MNIQIYGDQEQHLEVRLWEHDNDLWIYPRNIQSVKALIDFFRYGCTHDEVNVSDRRILSNENEERLS